MPGARRKLELVTLVAHKGHQRADTVEKLHLHSAASGCAPQAQQAGSAVQEDPQGHHSLCGGPGTNTAKRQCIVHQAESASLDLGATARSRHDVSHMQVEDAA